MPDPSDTPGTPQNSLHHYLEWLADRIQTFLVDPATAETHSVSASVETPPPLEGTPLAVLQERFQMSAFEIALLALCVGVELYGRLGELCARLNGGSGRRYATFGLALATLPDPHWSALSLPNPLRQWRLVELLGEDSLTTVPLRIDERILQFVQGIDHLPSELEPYVAPLVTPADLLPSHQLIADRAARALSQTSAARLHLKTAELEEGLQVAAVALAGLSHKPYLLLTSQVRSAATERALFQMLWDREALLSGAGLVLLDGGPDLDRGNADRSNAAALFARLRSPVVWVGPSEPFTPGLSVGTIPLSRPSRGEQRAAWIPLLTQQAGIAPEQGAVIAHYLARDFDLPLLEMRAVAAALALAPAETSPDREAWRLCRERVMVKLEGLAQRIMPKARWEDLVLPEEVKHPLQALVTHVRLRDRVLEEWGFARTGSHALGTSALFAGPSGTGKTLAAEVIAGALGYVLYRIDLSSVVSKYIGETEKNLARIFDAAEGGPVILLFDEADALFGKRSEVRDSHDRHANVEVAFLLQRMETFQGLSILTTNARTAIDTAFLRRLRFVVRFPFPEAVARAEIWRRAFPKGMPIGALDFNGLARLNVSGGHIANIALISAFMAAEQQEPVNMDHVLKASELEYIKLDKQLNSNEVRGWIAEKGADIR